MTHWISDIISMMLVMEPAMGGLTLREALHSYTVLYRIMKFIECSHGDSTEGFLFQNLLA